MSNTLSGVFNIHIINLNAKQTFQSLNVYLEAPRQYATESYSLLNYLNLRVLHERAGAC